MNHGITINFEVFRKYNVNRTFSEKRKGEAGGRNQRKE